MTTYLTLTLAFGALILALVSHKTNLCLSQRKVFSMKPKGSLHDLD